MKLSKLPKEKRNQLILVILITLVVLAGLGFGLIKYQYDSISRRAEKKAVAEKELRKMQDSINHASRLEAELGDAKKVITDLENGMASGDLYSWVINKVKRFKAAYQVDVPQFSPISQPTDVNLLPKFPYKQATLSVSGTAHYHDFGKFLADFENEFPHVRVLNLNLELNLSPGAGEKERLAFKMDIVTLVKPNPS